MRNSRDPKKKSVLLVIDPCLQTPTTHAYNTINGIFGELAQNPEFRFSHMEYVLPNLLNQRARDFFLKMPVGAVISLGSFANIIANITDNFPFVDDLCEDLQRFVIKEKIPFFGICFSHQLYAYMHKGTVNYLKERQRYFLGKIYGFREFEIVHSKLSLLATKFKNSDYFSNNKLDLDFKDAVSLTKNWSKNDWKNLESLERWKLTAPEERFLNHIQMSCAQTIISHGRHEQEVHRAPCQTTFGVTVAGKSAICEYDAFVNLDLPIYTFQTHPETYHEEQGGHLLIKNFLYKSSLLLS